MATFDVWDLDSIPTEDGWEVNDRIRCGSFEVSDEASDQEILSILVRERVITERAASECRIEIHFDDDGTSVVVIDVDDGEPLYELERIDSMI